MSNLSKDELSIIYLDYLGVSRKRIYTLLKYTLNPYDALNVSRVSDEIREILGKDKSKKLEEYDFKKSIKNIESYFNDEDVNAITILDENFPKCLLQIPDPPLILYYQGDISLLKEDNLLGVVGTRKPSAYGRSVTEKFVSELVKKGNIITVSGLAYGIDSLVARTTLDSNGKTIAVLGGGVKQIYPTSNTSLAAEIVKTGGLVISEYFPTLRPTQYTFPERNRIISGASKGVLIIEAGEKSGSLITANFAIEQGKELFIVPGNITSENSLGSNSLIEELPHAFTISTKNIFKAFNINTSEESAIEDKTTYSKQEQAVIQALKTGEKTIDELCEILREDFKTLNLLLTEMEIGGIIKKLIGDYYAL